MSATGKSSEKIKEEIEELEAEKEENIEKMEKIEDEIENLAESAEQHILEAAKAQETTVNEHEEETKAVLDENIQAYINANKEGGEGMTRDELQENIKGAMPNTPEIADAVAALTAASEEVGEIDSCLGELNKLITDTQLIEEEIELKNEEYEAAVKAEEEAKAFLSSLDKKEEVNEEIAEDGIIGQSVEDSDSEIADEGTLATEQQDDDRLREKELMIAA